ncbi:hypothetical protein [Bacillus nitratireducens]|uniref:hypothetical protein n=1 Tax=Bacillus nitratireducens TaxID=2026193 RepID=UPI0011A7F18C|nr:hypothetical protein [Bacillus nitratireducens]
MDRSITLEKASKYIMEDLLYLSKMREGRRKEKFFSTTFIEGLVSDAIDDVLRENGKKLTKKNRAAFITKDALNQLNNNNNNNQSNLVIEHIVCKNIYFNEIKHFLTINKLDPQKIFEILDQYYLTAIVTKSEDQKLDSAGLRTKMVANGSWDKKDIFSRYTATEIKLINNPYFIFET